MSQGGLLFSVGRESRDRSVASGAEVGAQAVMGIPRDIHQLSGLDML